MWLKRINYQIDKIVSEKLAYLHSILATYGLFGMTNLQCGGYFVINVDSLC